MGARFVVEPHVFGWWRIVDRQEGERIVRICRDRMVAEVVAERLERALLVHAELRRAA